MGKKRKGKKGTKGKHKRLAYQGKPTRHTISVCMIVKNEAERIERAIQSVLPFADEVVVVDTGSTDDTVNIAKKLGAKVGFFQWCDDFAAARNASIDLATGDWIMWLDADDYIPHSEGQKIAKLKGIQPDRGFMFLLKNEKGSQELLWQLRMFPRHPQIRFRFPVHEQAAPSLNALRIPIEKANITIIHTGYDAPETVREKKERYLGMFLRHLEKNPHDMWAKFHIGVMNLSTGANETAAKYLEAVASDNDFLVNHPGTYQMALIHLGRAYLKMKSFDKAREALEKALSFKREVPGLLVVSLAECYNQLGLFKLALQLFERYQDTLLHPSLIPCDMGAIECGAIVQKVKALEGIGDLAGALSLCRKPYNFSGRFDDLRILSTKILERIQKRKDAHKILGEVCRNKNASAEDLLHYGNSLVRQGNYEYAEKAFRKAIVKAPYHGPSLRALAALLKATGRVEEAIETLEKGLKCADKMDYDLIDDLADLYFDAKEWKKILVLPPAATLWAVRFAAFIHSKRVLEANDRELMEILNPVVSALDVSEDATIQNIWNAASVSAALGKKKRFYLATACFTLDPQLKGAADIALEGFLARGHLEDALNVAETFARFNPGDPEGFVWLARCYERQGAHHSASLALQKASTLTQSLSISSQTSLAE